MRVVALLVALGGFLAGCGPASPYLWDLTYTPNAALVGEMAQIGGSVSYSDQDLDISMSVVTLFDPADQVISRSSPMPITSATNEVTGQISVSVMWTPDVAGMHHFEVYAIDLQNHESNRVRGAVKVVSP